MKPIRNFLDRHVEPMFAKGGKLEKLYPLYEAGDTFLYSPKDVTKNNVHVRDAMDLKRMMTTVMVALMPCIFMAMYNTGYQANAAMASLGVSEMPGIRGWFMGLLGIGYDPNSIFQCLFHGSLYFVPIYAVTMVVGIFWEVLFCSVRGHEVNEGFFVSGLLIPLTLPATIPLWQVALATTFGVVVAKEIFGGTGRNFLNPALTARAFLFFAYPAEISGDSVWTAVDGFTGATALSVAGSQGMDAVHQMVTLKDAFIGNMQGSMGETSALACLIGAGILIISGIANWRIMASMIIGAVGVAWIFNTVGSTTNPLFAMSPTWHLVLGGFAFGCVFMATDPVTAAMTDCGKWTYGLLIGALIIIVRVINPAYPEGTMLAILFGNCFAPLFDYYVVRANKKRRALKHA